MQKKCKECGILFKGRADKKFCSDYCRNQFHNRLNSRKNNYIRHVNNILRRNRRILENFYPDEQDIFHPDIMIRKGFDFRYFTHFKKNKAGGMTFFCYEYGYYLTGENSWIIIKNDPEE